MARRKLLQIVLIAAGLLLLLAAGYLLSLYLIPTPQIAVIRLEGDIWGTYTAYLRQALEDADSDPAVRAVVLDIVSPGGEVTASEDLYFEVLRLREHKPVIASVGELAASGAYYIASAADQIYAKPGSIVGNIGVITLLPEPDLVDEELFTTGPFKLSGGSQAEAIRQLEMLKETFLARGEVYLGLQAQQMGLVDEVGSQGDAIATAARMARLRTYQVTDRTPEIPEDLFLVGFQIEGGATAATVADVPGNLPPGFYYRYVETPQ
jgi:protease-4